jgi:hypothetical protein
MKTLPKLFLIFLFFLLFVSKPSLGQDQLGFYLCGVTTHKGGDPNALLMPLRLTPGAEIVLNFGVVVQYKKKVYNRITLAMIQTFQADCAMKASEGSAVCIGFDFLKSPNHEFIFAIGPAFYVRGSWYSMKDYVKEDLKLSRNKKWQYLFFPIVPHIEYTYFPKSGNLGISAYAILDPIKKVSNTGFGIIYKLNHVKHT